MQFVKIYYKGFWHACLDTPNENLVIFYREGDKIAHFSIPMELIENYEIDED